MAVPNGEEVFFCVFFLFFRNTFLYLYSNYATPARVRPSSFDKFMTDVADRIIDHDSVSERG